MNEPYSSPGYTPQSGYPIPPRRQGMGCFAKGCIGVAILLVLFVGALGALGWYLFSNVQPFLGSRPTPIHTYAATPAQYSALVDRFQAFLTSLQAGQTATIQLSADDLNTIVAYAPDARDMQGRAFFSIVNNELVAEASVPLPTDGRRSAGRPTYYFNGKVTFTASFENGEFAFGIRKLGTLDGKPSPALVTRLIDNPDFSRGFNESFNESFRKKIDASPEAAEMINKIRTVVIQGNQIVITAAPAQSTTPTAP